MHGRPPLLTIITVANNEAHLLEGTIHSVLEQTYPHIEYLVIDRGSNDFTSTILKLAERTNQRLISGKLLRISNEPGGHFETMNRGKQMSSGDFILFLPPGDRLFERNTVEKIMRQTTPETDVLFGDSMLVSPTRRQIGKVSEIRRKNLPEKISADDFENDVPLHLSAFVVRKTVAPDFSKNSVADIDWMISILKKSRQAVNTGLVVSEILSRENGRPSYADLFQVRKKHFGFWSSLKTLWDRLGEGLSMK